MNIFEHILGAAGLIYVFVFGGVFVAAIWFVSRKRMRQHAEVAAMKESDEEGPPLDAMPDDSESVNLNYASGRAAEWDEYAGNPDEPPEDVRRPGPNEKMVRIESGGNIFEIDLLRAALLNVGIWAFVDGDNDVLGPVGLSKASLRVPENDVERAEQLIAETRQKAQSRRISEGRAGCPACGYDLRGTPERCPECGLSLA